MKNILILFILIVFNSKCQTLGNTKVNPTDEQVIIDTTSFLTTVGVYSSGSNQHNNIGGFKTISVPNSAGKKIVLKYATLTLTTSTAGNAELAIFSSIPTWTAANNQFLLISPDNSLPLIYRATVFPQDVYNGWGLYFTGLSDKVFTLNSNSEFYVCLNTPSFGNFTVVSGSRIRCKIYYTVLKL